MASRMEKYYNNPPVSRRSQKNIDLYRTLYDNEEYTNIASVATIDKTNEVDITKIRQMIKDRENYKKQREINQIIKPVSKEEKIEQPSITHRHAYTTYPPCRTHVSCKKSGNMSAYTLSAAA